MFWLILISALVWGFLHSLLASLKAKEVVEGWLGEKRTRFYRLVYNILAGLSFLPILVIAAMAPDRMLYRVPPPWSVLMGFGEFLAGVALLAGLRQTDVWEFLGLQQLNRITTGGQAGNPLETVQGNLVTTGLYRFVRHPLYSSGVVFIWLFPMMTVNLLAINISLTIYVLVGAYFEERKLMRQFGQAYADYAAITPMFIPFLKGNKTSR